MGQSHNEYADTTRSAGTGFLRYQRGSFVLGGSMRDMEKEHLRQLLVGCLKLGSMMTFCFETLKGVDVEALFSDGFFPRAVLSKTELFKEEVWSTLLRPDQGDPEPHEFLPRDDFSLCVVVREPFGEDVPLAFQSHFCRIELGSAQCRFFLN